MVNIRLKILDKGHIVQEQLIRVLQRHEDALESNTTGDSAIAETVGDETGGLVKDVADIQTAIGDESTEGTILARIKALEDAE